MRLVISNSFQLYFLPANASADNWFKQFEPSSRLTKGRTWSGSDLLDIGIPERILWKSKFWGKNQQTTKTHERLSSMQRVRGNIESRLYIAQLMWSYQPALRIGTTIGPPLNQFDLCRNSMELLPISPYSAVQKTEIRRNCFKKRERSGSVVECLTRDRRVAGSSLTGVTALWSLSKTHLS